MTWWARNLDRGHPRIVAALKAAGAVVVPLSNLAAGAPDLMVGYRGQTYLLEVKAPVGPKGGDSADGQHLSEDQLEWHARWRGRPVVVVRDSVEALRAIGAVK